jgi:ketosteroid isomerase-like protein
VSQENIEIVGRSVAIFQSDADAWVKTLDRAFEWYPLEEGNRRSEGIDAALGIRRRWLESWEGHGIDVEEMLDAGDSVVACLHLTGTGKESGAEVDLRFYMHFKLRDGKITYLYEHADRDEALRAAGLPIGGENLV